MKLNLSHLLPTQTNTFFTESGITSLTATQKKIMVVVSLALGLLAACIALWRCYPKKFLGEAKINDNKPAGNTQVVAQQNVKPSENLEKIHPENPKQQLEVDDTQNNIEAEERVIEQDFEKGTPKGFDETLNDHHEEINGGLGNGKGVAEGAENKETNDALENPQIDEGEDYQFPYGGIEDYQFTSDHGLQKIYDEGKTTYSLEEKGEYGGLQRRKIEREEDLNGRGKIKRSGKIFKRVQGQFAEHSFKETENGKFVKGKLKNGRKIIEGQSENIQFRDQDGCKHKFKVNFEGSFKEGLLCGQAEKTRDYYVISETGKMQFNYFRHYEGSFRDGKLNGPGKIVLKSWTKKVIPQQELHITGQFKDGKLHGQGKQNYYFGPTVRGIFSQGSLHGKGKINYPCGKVDKGEFKNGILNTLEDKRNGEGKIIYCLPWNGTKILENKPFAEVQEGQFKDGKLNGKGRKYVFISGHLEEGEFKAGLLVKGTITSHDNSVHNID